MADDPKPKRGMPRSLIFAMIPLGFILLVLLMVLGGETTPDSMTPDAPEAGTATE